MPMIKEGPPATYTDEEKALIYTFKRKIEAFDMSPQSSFWMNQEETKFVTVFQQELQLFNLPHVFKCEKFR